MTIFFFLDEFVPEIWIEGIGSTLQFLNKSTIYCVADFGIELNCFEKAGNKIYKNSNYNSCWYQLVGIGELNAFRKQSLTIYPNPSSGKIQIDSLRAGQTLIFQDSKGRVVMKRVIQEINSMVLNVMIPGFYFLQTLSPQGHIISIDKVIVQ